MANSREFRVKLPPKVYGIVERIRSEEGLTKSKIALKLLKEGLRGYLEQHGGFASVTPPQRKVEEVFVRVHINTRQYAKFSKLQAEVPECYLEVDPVEGKRDLLYPKSRGEFVRSFLASCPTGARKKTSLEELKSYKGRTTQKHIILKAIVELLGHPMSLDDLNFELRTRGCYPSDSPYPKGVIREYLAKDLKNAVEYDRSRDVWSLAQNGPRPLEEAIAELQAEENLEKDTPSVTFEVTPPEMEPPMVEGDDGKKKEETLPAFFPRWAKPIG